MAGRDEEGYDPNITYQEGAGYVNPATGQVTNYVPQQQVGPAALDTSMWGYEKAQNKGLNYTPQQLGWVGPEADRFTQAGIDKLPSWFNKESIMSGEFHLGSRDPIQGFIDIYNTPMDQATQQWDAAKKANQYLTGSGGSVDDPAFREAYLRNTFGAMNNARDNWWDRNEGLVMGVGGVASIAGGAALSGFGIAGEGAVAGAEGGAAAGGGIGAEAGGGWLGALEGGMGAYGPGGAGAAGGIEGLGGAAGAIGAGQAAGADVGMGAGTSWLTDLGLPASYGNDLGALMSYGYDYLGNLNIGNLLDKVDLGNLIGGGTGIGTGTQPTSVMGGGTTSAPQTSQILQPIPMGAGGAMAPATMPTGSIMSAYGDKGRSDDYKKYFSNLF